MTGELGGVVWRVSAARPDSPGRTWRIFSTEGSARRCLGHWSEAGYVDLRAEAAVRGPWQSLIQPPPEGSSTVASEVSV